MKALKITINNNYFPYVTETFVQPAVDILDRDEVEYAIEECCGEYLDMHEDVINALAPDVDFETIAEACSYIVEEINI